MPINPNFVPPNSAEAINAALAKAIREIQYIRERGDDCHVRASDVADAFEAILDLVAPHWRPMNG